MTQSGNGPGFRQAPEDEPAIIPGYHRFYDMANAVDEVQDQYPDRVTVASIGTSFARRHLWMARVTNDAREPHPDRPAVLITAGQHAREHLSVEMAIFILRALAAHAGPDDIIRHVLDRVVVFIVFNVNPDGSEFDFESRNPGTWRKNRQPSPGTEFIGTDLNRNWGYMWGLTTSPPQSDDYDGPEAFSAPETAALRDFILAHTVAGSERIRAAIDWHTYAEAILYPLGYTDDPVVPGVMSQEQHDVFGSLARAMAGNPQNPARYRCAQSGRFTMGSKCGVIIDWLWGEHGILAFTVEMYPPSGTDLPDRLRFLPPPEVISRETMRAFPFVRSLLLDVSSTDWGGD